MPAIYSTLSERPYVQVETIVMLLSRVQKNERNCTPPRHGMKMADCSTELRKNLSG
jgi:hypothetical protein